LTLPVTDRHTPTEIEITFAAQSDQPASATQPVDPPFVHVLEYTTAEDTRQHLGSVVLSRPSDGSPFDAEIRWELHRGPNVITPPPQQLKACTTDQVIHSPFADDPDTASSYWTASTTLSWQGQTFHNEFHSRVLRPAVNLWRTAIYNPVEQPLNLDHLLSGDPSNAAIAWTEQSALNAKGLQNLNQPFGLTLLEHERALILEGAPREAVAQATLVSPSMQDAILYVLSVGKATAYCNGQPLTPVDPPAHATFQPMFPSWMPPTRSYYALPLREGANHLLVVTRPTDPSGWCGLGAIVLDPSGAVLTEVASV
jgi:hypothetical protein